MEENAVRSQACEDVLDGSLDRESEVLIQKALKYVVAGRTSIAIADRCATEAHISARFVRFCCCALKL
jgi:hypothetical protein